VFARGKVKMEKIMKTDVTIIAITLLVFGCITFGCKEKEVLIPKYHRGQIVHMVLDGREAQVIRAYNYSSQTEVRYDVRVGANSAHTQFLGGEVEQAPYSRLYVREFELRD
jgi:hypothetical protein